MATNKNALIRYKVLDNCFRNPGKRYFIGDLIEECEKVLLEIDSDSNGISRRQILDDIAFMESKDGWKIELIRTRDGRKVFYSYADPGFSINNMPLNEVEINQLRDAIKILDQLIGLPQSELIHTLLPKLENGKKNEKNEVIMAFDSNEDLKGIEYLGDLHSAIFYKKVLSIIYKPFENAEAFEVILHPYYLKQYNNRWFLFGYNAAIKKYSWNMALDRIISVEETKGKFHKNTEINWKEYFEDIIGVTKPEDGKVEELVLHFKGKTGYYVETKPLHGSQKPKWLDENTFQVRLELIINYELERLILSYADTVKVIQPLHFAEKIRERLENALQQ